MPLRRRRKRIFQARGSGRIPRRLAGIVVLAGLGGWAATHLHVQSHIPSCNEGEVRREVAQALARMTEGPQRDIAMQRLRREREAERGPASSDIRHCSADVVIGSEDTRVVRFNVVPADDPAGYRVEVADVRSQAERR